MFDSTNHDTMRLVLKAFSEAAKQNSHGSYAYAAGYYESTVLRMFAFLPKRAQKGFIDEFVRAAQKQEREVIEKMNENKTLERV